MAGAITVCASLGYPGVLDIGSSGQGIATPCRASLCGTVASSNLNATVVCQAQGKLALHVIYSQLISLYLKFPNKK